MQALGEAGVRGFSRPGVESSSLYDNTVGAVFPQPAEFFFCTIFSFSANSVSLACQLRDGSSHQGTVTSMEENNDTFVLHSEQERVRKLLD